ncbi:hypothetical protein K2173_017894 [Erythroxylum novogranatense]|uniref:NTF2-like domain-containing protein n=1 Tax=Erythroxylum novogranatense TaxID=1862640 RepID=A0AAV8T350_9ROSI|nr:hypothetical protein K2173_017894 [Erythroxylum novogranatense]
MVTGSLLSFTGHCFLQRIHGIRCCSGSCNNGDNYKRELETKTPQVLKLTVSGVTELLRLFSLSNKDRLDTEIYRDGTEEVSVSSIDEVVRILESDYENAYFVTGIFTSAIYTEDCIFEDPTIKFQGTQLYARNLKLLVPFFDRPSISLRSIEKGVDSNTNFVLATWQLRTYLKFPWKPLILIDGRTLYELDDKFKIVKHVESWNVSALQAIGQIFSWSSWNLRD